MTEPPRPNVSEIAATRFIAPVELDREFAAESGGFTPWFRMEWETLKTTYGDRLERYTRPEAGDQPT